MILRCIVEGRDRAVYEVRDPERTRGGYRGNYRLLHGGYQDEYQDDEALDMPFFDFDGLFPYADYEVVEDA